MISSALISDLCEMGMHYNSKCQQFSLHSNIITVDKKHLNYSIYILYNSKQDSYNITYTTANKTIEYNETNHLVIKSIVMDWIIITYNDYAMNNLNVLKHKLKDVVQANIFDKNRVIRNDDIILPQFKNINVF